VSEPQKTPPAPQSNQNAGAGEKSCPWCRLWNAAFNASDLDLLRYGSAIGPAVADLLRCANGVRTLLAGRDCGDCKGCKRSAEIYHGDRFGDERRKWRWDLVNHNSTSRALFKLGPHDWQVEP
jgi:hypothetical protein